MFIAKLVNTEKLFFPSRMRLDIHLLFPYRRLLNADIPDKSNMLGTIW